MSLYLFIRRAKWYSKGKVKDLLENPVSYWDGIGENACQVNHIHFTINTSALHI